MQPTNKKQKDLILVLGSSLILVVFWVGFNIYHAATTSTISEDLAMQVTSIDGTFDTKTLKRLKGRIQVTPAFQLIVATPTATLSPTPISTSSASASTSAKTIPGGQ